MINSDSYTDKKAFTDLLIAYGYEYLGYVGDDDWEYTSGNYIEKTFDRQVVCYDQATKKFYLKIKRNEV
jgi:hypothetical protein